MLHAEKPGMDLSISSNDGVSLTLVWILDWIYLRIRLGFYSSLGFKEEKISDLHLLLDFPGLEELQNRLGKNGKYHDLFWCGHVPCLFNFILFFLFVCFFHKYLQCSAIHICQVNHLVLITADEKQLAIIIACFSWSLFSFICWKQLLFYLKICEFVGWIGLISVHAQLLKVLRNRFRDFSIFFLPFVCVLEDK